MVKGEIPHYQKYIDNFSEACDFILQKGSCYNSGIVGTLVYCRMNLIIGTLVYRVILCRHNYYVPVHRKFIVYLPII